MLGSTLMNSAEGAAGGATGKERFDVPSPRSGVDSASGGELRLGLFTDLERVFDAYANRIPPACANRVGAVLGVCPL